jgi:hypothetical protein
MTLGTYYQIGDKKYRLNNCVWSAQLLQINVTLDHGDMCLTIKSVPNEERARQIANEMGFCNLEIHDNGFK